MTKEQELKIPKVFISYSWSNPEYQEKVTMLVNRLRENGVETVYDKYDLQEGADMHVFMEKCKNDKTINKVLVLCDKRYAENADLRKGGVGIETLIISPEVYKDLDPSGKEKKFIPIVMERDETGKAYLPTYLEGKKYFDFSQFHEIGTEEFEQLVRYLYQKPLLQAPELGTVPSYILESTKTYLGTTSKRNDAISALKNEKKNAAGYCKDFFNAVLNSIDSFLVDHNADIDELEEEVYENINKMLPLRNEFLDVVDCIINYNPSDDNISVIKSFFEKLIPYRTKVLNKDRWNEIQSDHLKFFAYDIYINTVAKFIDAEIFDKLDLILDNLYYEDPYSDSNLKNLNVFYPSQSVFEHRNNRLKLNRISLLADTIYERDKHANITFDKIMQADLFMYIYGLLRIKEGWHWYPLSLLYAYRRNGALEIFARATSKKYFKKFSGVLGLTSESIKELMEYFQKQPVSFDYHSINLAALSNLNNLGAKD